MSADRTPARSAPPPPPPPPPILRARPLTVHVVSHTHWDREWYLPAGRFRQHLVALIDELLDPASEGRRDPFLLDGQAIVLEDYLAIRPEQREALSRRLADRSLEAGPWYVLADELIPSGEALVRNLLIGRATLASLGAEPPPVLYSPDAFGHPAALPALAAGFGCEVIVLWRGYGGPAWPAGDTVRWRSPDGTMVLLYHLSPDGYELGANLPASPRAAVERWRRLREILAPRAVLGVTLLPNGADHHAPQPHLAEARAALAKAAAPDVVRVSSLRTFAADLAARAREAELPCIAGELRASYGYTWTLQGTFGTRAYLKRHNAHVERLLVRDTEPWVALAAFRRAPARRHTRRALVQAAWRTLLQCHPHDTLCGCAIDEVARAMAVRLESAAAEARGLRDDALLDLIAHDPATARERASDWRPVVIVRNAAARPRGGIAELEVVRVRHPVRVGPGSGSAPAIESPPRPFSLDEGRTPFQVLHDSVRHDRVESPVHYPHDALVDAARVVAWLDPVAGYGTHALAITPPAPTPPAPVPPVHVDPRTMDNGLLRVGVEPDGRITLESREPAMRIAPLLYLEDVGDVGDLYTHSPRPPVLHSATCTAVERIHAGPLRGELRTTWRLDVPVESTRERRSASTEPVIVHIALTLDAAAPVCRVRVWGENRCRDHRLRIVFATGLAGATVWADAAFGSVRREPIPEAPATSEAVPPTAPLARYVTLATAHHGVTVYADGLAEYEATPSGDVAVTLLRAVGELSRNDLPERPGHAGWPVPAPEAQSLGPFEACFAIFPHGPRTPSTIHRIEQVADDVLLPLTGSTLRSALTIPPPTAGITLEGEGLALLAIKEADGLSALVLRCVNLIDQPVEGRWRCAFAIGEASLARLDETPLAPLEHTEHEVPFHAGPHAVVTILVHPATAGSVVMPARGG